MSYSASALGAGVVSAREHVNDWNAMVRPTVKAGQLTHLWRARRRHAHVDAVLAETPEAWTVQYLRNDKPLVTMEFTDERTARHHARTKLRELQLAGWMEHW